MGARYFNLRLSLQSVMHIVEMMMKYFVFLLVLVNISKKSISFPNYLKVILDLSLSFQLFFFQWKCIYIWGIL